LGDFFLHKSRVIQKLQLHISTIIALVNKEIIDVFISFFNKKTAIYVLIIF